MHIAIRTSLVVSVLLFLLAACGGGRFGGQSDGQVAVVDLNKVAAATGYDKRINNRVQGFAKAQEAALTKLRDDSRAKVDKQRKQLPANASDDAKRKLAAMSQKLDGELSQELTKAQRGARQLRGKLNRAFRGEVAPVAQRIAAQRGMDIVMAKQNDMLFVDPGADITDAVIDAMLKNEKQQAPAAAASDTPAK